MIISFIFSIPAEHLEVTNVFAFKKTCQESEIWGDFVPVKVLHSSVPLNTSWNPLPTGSLHLDISVCWDIEDHRARLVFTILVKVKKYYQKMHMQQLFKSVTMKHHEKFIDLSLISNAFKHDWFIPWAKVINNRGLNKIVFG